ncbi:5-oxoprolinase isoform X2 [Hemicordylus capensis]|uniref:5-oxoprolinase isoform X2 n=1 Tax=Hemicordylus capensis TaxID=884348 RepID=UPI0023026711|nr:5-oxoprolinase isoform X2 [Hemicordylus capensis]
MAGPAAPPAGKFQFAIDRGGTFTDVFARGPGGQVRVLKLLSDDPGNYGDAPTEGIRRILEQECGVPFPKEQPLDTSRIEWIRMGTTVATNALLERKGERLALLITRGFRDLLHIGTQARPHIFDLEVSVPEMLYEAVVEVDERLALHREGCRLFGSVQPVTGLTGDSLVEQRPVDLAALRGALEGLLARGICSLAVVLLHSYLWPEHEWQVGALARELGFRQVSLSSEVMPMVRAVPRGFTACADAYLTPCIRRYLHSFRAGFASQLQGVPVLFMRSDGGLTPMEAFSGSRAILSGPAGGVVGYAVTTYSQADGRPVIGFDMGGTSTDVSRYAGEFEHVFEATTAGISIQAPQLDINTVAAGGGSRLFFRSGLFVVGPESAGAHPGPACYRKGGPLTVTDANLCLGRLLPDYFPRIFGPTEDLPLSQEATLLAFQELTAKINAFLGAGSTLRPEEVAMGFIQVANEAMCRPIRALTQARGHDTSRHVLACFGGAGGQHACAIARALGMPKVFVHKHSGVLSAYGLALADVVHEAQEPCSLTYGPEAFAQLDQRLAALEQECVRALEAQGFARSQIGTEPFLHLRYERTDCALMCSARGYPATPDSCCRGDFGAAFAARYLQEFGFTIPSRTILVDDVRVRGTASLGLGQEEPAAASSGPPRLETVCRCYFEGGYLETSVYLLEDLSAGHAIPGPSIILDKNSTILVEPGCTASVTHLGNICIAVGSEAERPVGPQIDPIQLSIFSHRFMSIAEQMGRVLQRTAISTNIKERLDFSCALFGPDGGLVSNAPHIPVHLGAMQETVQFQILNLGSDLREGDVILSNHPCAGGSHLPDLTVITPVFWPGEPRPVFFVASRGHHADIGGITPGSMPPHSHCLQEEGAVFISFKLVKDGVFQEEVTEALLAPGRIPGSSGTRNLPDNLSDLRAQVAANQKGIHLVNELIGQYGLEVVQAYMAHIQANAEVAVREMMRDFATRQGEPGRPLQVEAEDFMDDGSPIRLKVIVDPQEGSAVFDFTGSGHEVYGNCNAPRAITLSALIYCLRSMVGRDIPLNQGCLAPVQVLIPKGSILAPSLDAAVVGGNVLTSQRVVDVIFRAFEACAASQGCMNNVTFGNERVGYYETVAGGSGAGPHWHGRSGVHSHMTNTRITDPEILEKRYPVILRCFELAPGTGGAGRFQGGDGVRRELQFREEMVLSVLSERRAFRPYGLQGGEPGSPGLNLLIRQDGRIINLGGKTSVKVAPGDIFRLQTPGGGGFGLSSGPAQPLRGQGPPPPGDRPFVERGSVHDYRLSQEAA